jgi:hypothetical protein
VDFKNVEAPNSTIDRCHGGNLFGTLCFGVWGHMKRNICSVLLDWLVLSKIFVTVELADFFILVFKELAYFNIINIYTNGAL